MNQEPEKNEMPVKAQVTEIEVKRDVADSIISVAENIMSEEDYASEFSREDLKNNKEFAIVSYIPLVVFYILYLKKHKQSKYLRFHVNQGLLLSIGWILVVLVSTILTKVFEVEGLFIIKIPFIISVITYILYSFIVLLNIFGLVNTIRNKSKKLPIIGKIKIIRE